MTKNLLLSIFILASLTVFSQTGTHLNFDGNDDYVSISSTSNIPVGNSSYTIEAMINPSLFGNRGIVGWGNYGTDNQVNALRLGNGGLVNYWWNSDLVAVYTFNANTWYHVAATFDGTARKLFIDGVEVTSDTPTGLNIPNANNFAVGRTFTNEYFGGGMDEVRVWNVARTTSEISNNKDKELLGTETGLVAYYKFNQGTNNADNSAITTAIDSKDFITNGILNNFGLTGTTSNWVYDVNRIYNNNPVFTSIPVTSVNDSSNYSYTITTDDANREDAVSIAALTLPNWLTFSDYALVSTFSGSSSGFLDGALSTARFNNPKSVAVDDFGNLYVADYDNHRIRKISIDGTVSTLAGGIGGYLDGNGTNARFAFPTGVDVDAYGNVYVADHGNHRIRKITPDGTVTTFAGSSGGFLDGLGTAARFNRPLDVSIDNNGFVYVSDRDNHRIRKISPTGQVTTLASIQSPIGLEVDGSGTIYVANYNANRIEKVTSAGTVTTLAGQGPAQSLDGTGTAARFNRPLGLTIDVFGDIYVSEGNGHRIRKVTSAGVVTTIAGNSGGFLDDEGTTARFNLPYSIAAGKSGVLYLADDNNHRIRKIDISKKLEGTPNATQTGNHNVSLQVSDGNGGSATQNFTINVVDVTLPTITTLNPLDDTADIDLDSDLQITFTENILKGTGNIVIYDAADNTVVETVDVTSGNVTINNATVTINPTSDLAYNKSYYVQIAATAFKDTGNNNFVGILDATTWTFSTLQGLPVLTTADATVIGENNATFGGEVTNEGLASSVTERGIVFSKYALDTNPEIGELNITKIAIGSGAGAFTNTQISLDSNRKYAYRAYATNSAGTIYGDLKTFITDAKTIDTFITTWKTTDSNNNIIFLANSVDVKIDWGDGSAIQSASGDFNHIYANAGEYNIKISGDFSSFRIHPNSRVYLQSVEQWGNQLWKSFSESFLDCTSFSSLNATDTPNLTLTTSLAGMFENSSFNGDISNWNVSNVVNMTRMFNNAQQFNQPLNSWDVQKVTNFNNFLTGAFSFNQTLKDWQFNDNSNVRLDIDGAGISVQNVDDTLIGWVSNNTNRTNNFQLFFNSKYCNAGSAITQLQGYGWAISSGLVLDCTTTTPPVTGTTATHLNFDGVNDYIELANEASFDFTNQMTVEFWINSNNMPEQWDAIIAKGDTSWRFALNNSGQIGFAGTDSFVDVFSNTIVTNGSWFHVAGVHNGSDAILYINGIEEKRVSATSNIRTNNFAVSIGENLEATGRYYRGNIDEIKIWNIAKTASEISSNKDKKLLGSETNLVAYYQFNQGLDNENNSTVTTLNDKTTNNIIGTLHNFALTGTTSNWVYEGVRNINSTPTFISAPITFINDSDPYSYIISTQDTDQNDFLSLTTPVLPNWLATNVIGDVTTLAGSTAGNVDAIGSGAKFNGLRGLVVDKLGNVFVSDANNHRIRKITPNGNVTTFAGSSQGFLEGQGTSARFNSPRGLAIDEGGNLYVADYGNNRIRKIDLDGNVTTFAGNGSYSFQDGAANDARFRNPLDIAIDGSGNLYVSDLNNHRIRKIFPSGVVISLAGNGQGYSEGSGVNARFNFPTGIDVDNSGSIYVADYGNNRIRKITSTGTVTTFAGTGSAGNTDDVGVLASFNGPQGLSIDSSGVIYISELISDNIRKISTTKNVTTIAGSSSQGFNDGIGENASFYNPIAIANAPSGVLYVADLSNNRIRKLVPKSILKGTTNASQTGNHNVSLQVSDGNGGTATQSFTINVTDVTDPIISVISPLDEASNIAINTNLQITFSENILKGTGNITIYDASDDSVLEAIDVTSGNVTISNNIITINPTSDLAYNKSYYVQIAATAFKDTSNKHFVGIINNTTWNFSTIQGLPALTTTDASAIGENTVTFGGEVTNEGLASSVTERGIVYSIYALDTDPEIGESNSIKIIVGSGLGVFTNTQTSLESNRKYAYRAYAINSAGIIYGDLKTYITYAKTTDTFITKWKTTAPGQPVIFLANSVDVKVDWGDGSTIESFTGNFNHTYANAGDYFVKITGDFSSFQIHPASKSYLESVEQWGNQFWKSFSTTFKDCSNLLNFNASDIPNLSLTTSLFEMFRNTSFNGNIGNWDMSNITDFRGMFAFNTQFNQDISNWDVSNVTNFTNMFFNATSFNQSLGKWKFIDTSSPTLNITIPNISVANADATIIGWVKNAESRTNAVNITFPSTICKAVTSVNTLVGLGWTLNGVSTNCSTLDTNIFTATTDNNWSTSGNWSKGTIPTQTEDVEIPTSQTVLVNIPTVNANNLYVSGTINVPTNNLLNVNGLLDNKGTINITDAKLFVDDFAIGEINFNKTVNTDWQAIASPVIGETIEDIIANGSLASGTGGNLGLASYNNTLKPATGWQYVNTSSTGVMNIGTGYSLKRSEAGNIPFTGEVNTAVNSEIQITEGGTGINKNSWNLVGNPYLFPITAGASTASSNFLQDNLLQLNPSFAAIYKWNGSSYDIINLSSSTNTLVNPGESFFINSKSGGGLLKITKPELVVSSSKSTKNQFKNKNSELKIFVESGGQKKSTEIKYLSNATIGLDVGYDAGVFGGVSSNFDVFTHLVSNDNTNNFGIQCLPNTNKENYVVPVGIQLNEEKEVSFSAATLNLDIETKVYLEDKVTNTFTRLDNENDFYTIQLKESDSGVGRFYIHTSKTVLDVENNYLAGVNIYKLNTATLRVSGLTNGKNNMKIFNILGTEVLNTSFGSETTKDIALPKLAKGVYIVQLETEKGKLNKKIFLD